MRSSIVSLKVDNYTMSYRIPNSLESVKLVNHIQALLGIAQDGDARQITRLIDSQNTALGDYLTKSIP